MEDDPASSGQHQSGTPFISTTNLLDERNTRMSRRTTTTNFNALSSALAVASSPSSRDPSTYPDPHRTETGTSTPALQSEENLTLTERKTLLDRGTISPRPSLPRANSQTLIYDSHQPRRSNTVDKSKQNDMFTAWRQSLQHENTSAHPVAMAGHARQAMLSQRERAGHREAERIRRRESREARKDLAMRTGMLTSAHQEALRRMQSQVKHNGSGD